MAALSCACLVFILSTSHAKAAENLRQQVVYDVYAGGFHVVQATLDIDMRKKDRYSIVLDAHTRGFLDNLVPWKGVFESHGWAKTGDNRPEKHQSRTTWQGEDDVKEYMYNKNGTFKSLRVSDKHVKREKRDVKPEVTDNTIDVLTATLNVLERYQQTGKCEGEAEIFDGKRRFLQNFHHEGEKQLTPSKYNIYGGASAECIVEVTPINGEWSKKPRGWLSIQEQGRERGTMPTVWIGRLSETGPAVPVKIRVKTEYGTLFMHLAEHKSADKLQVSKKRKDREEDEE